jgi:hypothetical protein
MDGDGRRDDDSTVKDSGARRRWTARGQLDGEGRRVGDTTTMDDEDGASATAIASTWRPQRPTRHQEIKSRSSIIKLNNNFI